MFRMAGTKFSSLCSRGRACPTMRVATARITSDARSNNNNAMTSFSRPAQQKTHPIVDALLRSFSHDSGGFRPHNLYPRIVEDVIKPSPPDQWVSDAGNLLPDQAVTSINHLLRDLNKDTKAEVAVVVLHDLGSSSPPPSSKTNRQEAYGDFCANVFDAWGIGRRYYNDGVLLMLFVEGRRIEALTGDALARFPGLSEDELKRMQQKVMIPYLQDGNYGGAMEEGVQYISSAVRRRGLAVDHKTRFPATACNSKALSKAFRDSGSHKKGDDNRYYGYNDYLVYLYLTALCALPFVARRANEKSKHRDQSKKNDTAQAGRCCSLTTDEKEEEEEDTGALAKRSKARNTVKPSSNSTETSTNIREEEEETGTLSKRPKAPKAKRPEARSTVKSSSNNTETNTNTNISINLSSSGPSESISNNSSKSGSSWGSEGGSSSRSSSSNATGGSSYGSSSPGSGFGGGSSSRSSTTSSGGDAFGGGSSRGGSSAGSSW